MPETVAPDATVTTSASADVAASSHHSSRCWDASLGENRTV